jgi:dolichol kinase
MHLSAWWRIRVIHILNNKKHTSGSMTFVRLGQAVCLVVVYALLLPSVGISNRRSRLLFALYYDATDAARQPGGDVINIFLL